MDYLSNAALLIHIATGYVALMSGGIVMLSKKLSPRHRKIGRVFFYCMMGVSFSAIVLSLLKDKIFLLHIGIFVLYMSYAGFRSARAKNLAPSFPDIVLLLAAVANAVFMISSLHLVLVVFGSISLFLAFLDVRIYYMVFTKQDLPHKAKLARHISMMVGSYIGTLTAFLVVNVTMNSFAWVLWLAPTVVFVPMMQYWMWKFTRKRTPKHTSVQ